jgi:hypothetical protein
MTRPMLSSLASAAALAMAATLWVGLAAAASNTKPQEGVAAGSKLKEDKGMRARTRPTRQGTGTKAPIVFDHSGLVTQSLSGSRKKRLRAKQ